jgi:hypothetical protein
VVFPHSGQVNCYFLLDHQISRHPYSHVSIVMFVFFQKLKQGSSGRSFEANLILNLNPGLVSLTALKIWSVICFVGILQSDSVLMRFYVSPPPYYHLLKSYFEILASHNGIVSDICQVTHGLLMMLWRLISLLILLFCQD